jgi:endogenous inhibitor of DNA gyrase (YacG/DUF329 family)
MTMTQPANNVICPTCGKQNTWVKENKFRPFCSDRCKLIDLGDWASEKHRIAGEDVTDQEDSENESDAP